MRKSVVPLVAAILCAAAIFTGCGSAAKEQTYSSVMDVVTITDDEMLSSVQNAAKALQESVNQTDPDAVVEVVKNDDGSCTVYASGTNDDGSKSEKTELYKTESVKDMFEFFYNSGWIDHDGNVTAVVGTVSEKKG